jgi:hypothetical protein
VLRFFFNLIKANITESSFKFTLKTEYINSVMSNYYFFKSVKLIFIRILRLTFLCLVCNSQKICKIFLRIKFSCYAKSLKRFFYIIRFVIRLNLIFFKIKCKRILFCSSFNSTFLHYCLSGIIKHSLINTSLKLADTIFPLYHHFILYY